MPDDPATIWTIGHSTRTLEEFLGLLAEYRIEAIADVRRFPGSRRYPHFASDALATTLPAHGLAYQWIPKLGGRRKVQPGSPNTAWRNASFQGYADYTATAEFAEGLAETVETRRPQAHRADVRRGGVVALPPLDHCRRAETARHRSHPHHRRHAQHGAPVHIAGTRRGWPPELCVSAGKADLADRLSATALLPYRRCIGWAGRCCQSPE